MQGMPRDNGRTPASAWVNAASLKSMSAEHDEATWVRELPCLRAYEPMHCSLAFCPAQVHASRFPLTHVRHMLASDPC